MGTLKKTEGIFPYLLGGLGFLILLALALFALPIPLDPFLLGSEEMSSQARVLLFLRLPRVLIALFTGATLAASGAAVQGVFQNSLASPELLGITGGASVGALGALHFVKEGPLGLILPLAALLGGLLAAGIITLSSSRNTLLSPSKNLILGGLAISGILGSLVALLLFVSQEYEIKQFLFWMLGSLENRRWEHALTSLPLQTVVLLLLLWRRKDLDYFHLGYWGAKASGFPWESRRRFFLILAAVGASASVAAAGALGFLGLMIPHAARLWGGQKNQVAIPLSMVLGGCFLLVADLISQTLFFPRTFPVGLLTALIGGPFFLFLIQRRSYE